MNFEIDWGGMISAIVIKKDLDCGEFENCWEENYNWNEFDKFIIENYRDLLIAYGKVEMERLEMKINLKKDLKKYEKKVLEVYQNTNLINCLFCGKKGNSVHIDINDEDGNPFKICEECDNKSIWEKE